MTEVGKSHAAPKAEPAGNLLSLDRAITLLKAVADSTDGLRLTDAARVAALSPSTTHRILSALVEHHLLRLRCQENLIYLIYLLQTLILLQEQL